MAEEWRSIPGYEGLYEVSDRGGVRSLHRLRAQSGVLPGRVLKGSRHPRGYRYVGLHKDGTVATCKVHALVLLAFVGPYPPGMQVRHLDGDPANNRLDNLCYGTASENQRDNLRLGTNFNAKKTHCPQGHPYDEANTRRPAAQPNARYCRACNQQDSRRRCAERTLKRRLARAAAQDTP